VLERVRGPLVFAYNRWLALKSSRERSVKNVARGNSRRGFEKIFGSHDLLAEYLGPDRLHFYDEVADLCRRFTPRRVIDVGCGSGHLLAAIARTAPSVTELVGVDYARTAIRSLSEIVPSARGIVSNVHDLDLGGETFDLVVCTEVMEHLERPEAALEVLKRLCAPAGRIILSVPDGEHDNYEGHLNFWNIDEFRAFAARAGSVEVSRSHDNDLIAVVETI
jgi:2-polyprenyl-3-methyl-5-hydroxy-6-metoxy-1,4-benzoquinol methylase